MNEERFTLKELIKEENGSVRFPTLCGCAVCHGYTGFYASGLGTVKDREFAVKIALVQQGYFLKVREGGNWVREDDPKPCSCECEHEWSEKSLGMCLHQWTCKKCGHSMQVRIMAV